MVLEILTVFLCMFSIVYFLIILVALGLNISHSVRPGASLRGGQEDNHPLHKLYGVTSNILLV